MVLPLAFPAVVAGSIFTFSLTLGDYIAPGLITSGEQFIGNLILANFGKPDLPLAAAQSLVPLAIMIVYLLIARRLGAFEAPVMTGRFGRIGLIGGTVAVLVFLYMPLSLVIAYAFNAERHPGVATHGLLRFSGSRRRRQNTGLQDAFLTSVGVALAATAIAVVLGSLAALAVSRHRFFGRETISFLCCCRSRCPASSPAWRCRPRSQRSTSPLGFMAIVIGHATFCVVLVYNNVIARMRRVSRLAGGGLGGSGRATRSRRSGRDLAGRCARRSWPAPCSPSHCRSTR